jgi:hypothetical protein
MRRIIMLFVVAMVIAAMMLAMAMPVLAKTTGDQRGPGNQGPPDETGSVGTNNSHGSVVIPKLLNNPGACVDHYGGGSSGGATGGGCSG